MQLEFLSEPIEKESFVSHYIDLFIGVIKKTCEIDSFYPREQEYLELQNVLKSACCGTNSRMKIDVRQNIGIYLIF